MRRRLLASTLTIVVTNPAANPGNLTGVAINDAYTGTLSNVGAGSVACTGGGSATLTGGANAGTSVGFTAGTGIGTERHLVSNIQISYGGSTSTPTPTLTPTPIPSLVGTRRGNPPRGTSSPAPRLTLQPGVQATDLPDVTFTHVS